MNRNPIDGIADGDRRRDTPVTGEIGDVDYLVVRAWFLTSFTRVTIDENPPRKPYRKMVGDINGDGLLDILVAGDEGPLVCYTYPEWSKTEIAVAGWKGVKGATGDLDDDGDVDIVLGGVILPRAVG